MTDLSAASLDAAAAALTLPPALVATPGPVAAMASDDGAHALTPSAAQAMVGAGPLMVAHASLTARRLGLNAPARSRQVFDVLELFAFVRPARFCAPSATGLAVALGLPEPKGVLAQALALRAAARTLLDDLAATPWPSREEALALAETLARAGWAWGPLTVAALRTQPGGRLWRGSGLDVWTRLAEWEDEAPLGEAGSKPRPSTRASGWPPCSPAPAWTRPARPRRNSPPKPPLPFSPASGRANRA